MIQWRKSSHSQGGQGECVEVGIEWRKSSRSQPDGGECVELAIDWRKSSSSGPEGGECVEVAVNAIGAIRDSKHPDAPYLTLSPRVFATFLAAVKTGEHDL